MSDTPQQPSESTSSAKACSIDEMVRALREKSGCGLIECKSAFDKCGDALLAEGWLRYKNCAINVRPRPGETAGEARDRWVMDMARIWAELPNAELSEQPREKL